MKYVDVNKCIFSGRLCEDPEVKDIGDGKKLAHGIVQILPKKI